MVEIVTAPDHSISSALALHSGFAQFSPEQLEAIAPRFTRQTKAMGEPLLIADQLPTSLYLLQSGQLRQLVDHPSQPGSLLTLESQGADSGPAILVCWFRRG